MKKKLDLQERLDLQEIADVLESDEEHFEKGIKRAQFTALLAIADRLEAVEKALTSIEGVLAGISGAIQAKR